MSRHRKIHSNRSKSKLVALVASGAFAAASTTAGVAWPSGASASTAQLTSFTSAVAAAQSKPAASAQSKLAVSARQIRADEEKLWAQELAMARAQRAAAVKQKAAVAAAVSEKKARHDDSGSPEQIAQAMLKQFGWSSSEYSCLQPLWARESGWNVYAENPDGAYGIPQAFPGAKMASAGPDWESSAYTQIKWGLEYIRGDYGSPCGAWAHEEDDGWY